MGIFYRPTTDLFGKILACHLRSRVVSSYFFQNSQQCFAVALILQASKDAPSRANLLKEKKISVGEQTAHKGRGSYPCGSSYYNPLIESLRTSNATVLQSQENFNLMLMLC